MARSLPLPLLLASWHDRWEGQSIFGTAFTGGPSGKGVHILCPVQLCMLMYGLWSDSKMQLNTDWWASFMALGWRHSFSTTYIVQFHPQSKKWCFMPSVKSILRGYERYFHGGEWGSDVSIGLVKCKHVPSEHEDLTINYEWKKAERRPFRQTGG